MRELLKNGALLLGAELDEGMIESFLRYKELMLEWNSKFNLTAIVSDEDIAVKHFLDSLSLINSTAIKNGAKIADIGTGAGFPGIPLKICLPDSEVLLVDSLKKRVGFLNEVISGLRLENISAEHMRAEEGGRRKEYRDGFDVAVSRAVAKLRELCEYCLPYVKKDGVFAAMKGNDVYGELEEAKPAIKALNAEISDVKELTLPYGGYERTIVIIRKLRHTPQKYPRTQAGITKFPII